MHTKELKIHCIIVFEICMTSIENVRLILNSIDRYRIRGESEESIMRR